MNKFFSLLGLCKRAGKLVAGEVAAEQAVRKKQAYLLILAQDASKNTKKKFTNSAVYYELPWQKSEPRKNWAEPLAQKCAPLLRLQKRALQKN